MAKIVRIEVELIKFSRSLPLAYTDSMSIVDFFDYAEIIGMALNSGQESGGGDLSGSVESAISRAIPDGIDESSIPGLDTLKRMAGSTVL